MAPEKRVASFSRTLGELSPHKGSPRPKQELIVRYEAKHSVERLEDLTDEPSKVSILALLNTETV